MKGKLDRSASIGIIGAGPAGLSAAVYLRDAGFGRVTVLEKEKRPGGKCKTVRRDGLNWEMGAVLGTDDYEATVDLMGRVGMKPYRGAKVQRKPNDAFIGAGLYPMERLFPGWVSPSEVPGALAQLARYHLLARKWPAAFGPGHPGTPAELAGDFASWSRRYGMETLAKLFAIPFTTFGYGYYDEVPAAYVLKYFNPGIARALVNHRKFFNWKDGVQELWERTAASLNVRYGVDLVSASRPAAGAAGPVTLRAADGASFEFDRVVVACPYDDALRFLGADETEAALAAPIRHTDYYVHVLRIDGFGIPAGFAPGRFTREGIGKPMIWDERNKKSGTFTFYTLGDGKLGPEDVEAAIAADVALVGGTVRELISMDRWKYFPHVSPEDYAGGYYDRLESIQGRRATFIAGELPSFSTVECSVRYSRDLVRRFFV